MADTVTGPTIMQENDVRVVIKYVNQSDGQVEQQFLEMFQQWQ